MTCINKSARRVIQLIGRGGGRESHVYVYLRSFSAYSLSSSLLRSSIIYPAHLSRRFALTAAAEWPVYFPAREIGNKSSRVLLACCSALDDSVIAVIFMRLLLTSKIIGGNELHRNALVSVFRKEGNCPWLCEEFSNSPVSNFSLTCLKFSWSSRDFNRKPNTQSSAWNLIS